MLALDTLDILHVLEYRKRILDAIKAGTDRGRNPSCRSTSSVRSGG
jgi:hypothetical protein